MKKVLLCVSIILILGCGIYILHNSIPSSKIIDTNVDNLNSTSNKTIDKVTMTIK